MIDILIETFESVEDYNARIYSLNDKFDTLMGFSTNFEDSPFRSVGYRENEFRHLGSFRSFLNQQFAILNLSKMYGLNIREWMEQPIMVMYQQMLDIPDIVKTQEDVNQAIQDEYEEA